MTASFKRLLDDGFQGLDPTLLDCFQSTNFAAFANSFSVRCQDQVSVDLDAFSKPFPKLAERKWLPEHFQRHTGLSPLKCPGKRLGDLCLFADHFYHNPDDWGYHLFFSIWLADNSTDGRKNPARLLYISNKDENLHDFGDFRINQTTSPQEQGMVFVSYVSEDFTSVSRLAADLQARGITVWLDKNNILPGENWREAIRTAIHRGAAFIACFSSNYANRDKTYMNEELQLAIEEMRQMSMGQKWFIPVLVTASAVPDYEITPTQRFSHIHHVRLYENWAASIEAIVVAIRHLYEGKGG
ncbi:MAG TPA: toll/interleukin-1 receptor domain-containing protein [Bryobacteraceae bacterium]